MDVEILPTEVPKKRKKRPQQKLTPKQLKLAKAYVECGNKTQAYRKVYNTKGKLTTAAPNAARLINGNTLVAAKVKELEQKLVITTETQVMKLEKIHDLAVADKQYPSAINAINSQSKHKGLLNEVGNTINVNIARAEASLVDVSPERLQAALAMLEE